MDNTANKRKQLHPKKQVILELTPQKSDAENKNIEGSSKIDNMVVTPKIISKQIINNALEISISSHSETSSIEVPSKEDTSSKPNQSNSQSLVEDTSEKKSIEKNANLLNEINIKNIKYSINQKLHVAEIQPSLPALYVEQTKRVSLTRRNIIAEQKNRKFYMDPDLPTTIIRNDKIKTSDDNNTYLNSMNVINNLINVNKDKGHQIIRKRKICPITNPKKLPQKIKNKRITATKLGNTETKEKEIMEQASTSNNVTPTFNQMNGNEPKKLLIREVTITPVTSDTLCKATFEKNSNEDNLQTSIEIVKVQVPDSVLKGSDDANSQFHDEQYIEENNRSENSTFNVTDDQQINAASSDGHYIACLQTVKTPSVSAIKTIASIRKLKETSPKDLREFSDNILDGNIDLINLINNLSIKSNNNKSSNSKSPKVNKLEEALAFAIGKNPRTITIIRKPKSSNNLNQKPSVNYIDRLDSALDNALGSNSQLLPFVRKLINTSASNFKKEGKKKNKFSKDGSSKLKKKNIKKQSKKDDSDTEDFLGFEPSEIPVIKNSEIINALRRVPVNTTVIKKNPEENKLANEKVIDEYNTTITKFGPILPKTTENTSSKSAILRNILTNNETNDSHNSSAPGLKNLSKNLLEKPIERPISNTNKPVTTAPNNLVNELVTKSSPKVPNKTATITSKDLEISSSPKPLSDIGPVKSQKSDYPIIIKRLIKKPSFEQNKPEPKLNAQENIENFTAALNLKIKKPATIVKSAGNTTKSKIEIKAAESHMEKLQTIKRKLLIEPKEQTKKAEVGLGSSPKRPKIASFQTVLKKNQTNEVSKAISDFNSLQTSVQAILDSNLYNQILSMETLTLPKVDIKQLKQIELKGLANFAVIHQMIQSILESPRYQQVLNLAKDYHNLTLANATSVSKTSKTKVKETAPLLDPDAIDYATLKTGPTVPDTLLPLLDKEESEEVIEKYIIHNVWNENKNQDTSFLEKPGKK